MISPDVSALYDAQRISSKIEALIKKPVFASYLKHFISKKLFKGEENISDETYLRAIIESFDINHTPAHFDLSTGSIRKLARNWLSQNRVKRETVLLIGFGLNMELTEVNDMLLTGLGEGALNPKDPLETLVFYCLKYRLKYDDFARISEEAAFKSVPKEPANDLLNGETSRFRERRDLISSEADLFSYLKSITYAGGTKMQSVTSRKHFIRLICECGRLIQGDAGLGDYSSAEAAEYPSIIEKELYFLSPRDEHGNLEKLKDAKARTLMSGGRLSRQRAGEILAARRRISRQDIITLSFLKSCLSLEGDTRGAIKDVFLSESAKALLSCAMGPVNPEIPYERLILLSLETDDPLNVFAEASEILLGGSAWDDED